MLHLLWMLLRQNRDVGGGWCLRRHRCTATNPFLAATASDDSVVTDHPAVKKN